MFSKRYVVLLLILAALMIGCDSDEIEVIEIPANSENLVDIEEGDILFIDVTVYNYDGPVILKYVDDGFTIINSPVAELHGELRNEALAPGFGQISWDSTFIFTYFGTPGDIGIGSFQAPIKIERQR